MRRFLSFLMASAILLAGLALGVFEIVRAEGIRPYLLVGAGLKRRACGWLMSSCEHGDAVYGAWSAMMETNAKGSAGSS
jgi:hypothetical protein